MGLQIYLSNMLPAIQGSQTSIGFEDKEQKPQLQYLEQTY